MELLKLNLITSELWPVVIVFGIIVYALYAQAKKEVAKGHFIQKEDEDGRMKTYKSDKKIASWYQHKLGKMAIVLAILITVFAIYAQFFYERWG